MRRRVLGAMAFAGTAAGGAALGCLAERRASEQADPGDWEESLSRDPVEVTAADGTRLHAEVSGREDAPTLVLAHGVGLSSRTWHHQRRDLAHELRVVAFDHRGHGRSERGEDCSIESLGHDLAAVIERCAPTGPLLLAGHSMGAMAILSLAEGYPGLVRDRVRGAAMCNTAAVAALGGALASVTAGVLSTVQARLAGSKVARGRLLRSQDPDDRPSTDLSLLLTRQFGMARDASPETVAFLERELRACPPIVLAAFAPGLATLDMREAAARLRLPTLVVVGERDRMTPPRQGRILAELLPMGDIVELAGVGHTTMLEAPDVVTGALRALADEVLDREVA